METKQNKTQRGELKELGSLRDSNTDTIT